MPVVARVHQEQLLKQEMLLQKDKEIDSKRKEQDSLEREIVVLDLEGSEVVESNKQMMCVA